MKPVLGCIADDITGATDLSLMLGRHGMPVVQYIGLPHDEEGDLDAAAVVIALKSRNLPVLDAVAASVTAARWLRQKQFRQLYFKYCSTFDSTDDGNIGPVINALLKETGSLIAPVCPAFPTNLRTVYQGHLFVGNQLLSESSMRHHPLTPMTDANLVRVLGRQLENPDEVGLMPLSVVEKGPLAVRRKLSDMIDIGLRFAIIDALTDGHLYTLAEAFSEWPLLTGGSGLAMGLPQNFRNIGLLESTPGLVHLEPVSGPALVLAGSCSAATRSQVEYLTGQCPALFFDPLAFHQGRQSIEDIVNWAMENRDRGQILVYSTALPKDVAAVQDEIGRQSAGHMVEKAMAEIATRLCQKGWRKFIIAGGETSGAVLAALAIRRLRIGPEIAPGVPWTISMDDPPILLALKSGNFGQKDFFTKALEMVT
jgi:uncharacterized protein YgbK (DUF1537 family)